MGKGAIHEGAARWVVAASAAGMLVGALVLGGWALDVSTLKRLLPGLVAMNPVTALLFILASASLWLQRERRGAGDANTSRIRLARVAALAVAAMGALKLGQYTLGWSVSVDHWLFRAAVLADGPTPNQMAPNSALNFMLTGAALCWLDSTTARGRRPADLLACVVFLIALLALTGYAYSVRALSGIGDFIPMALHTAVLFALLALGILCARPGAGIMRLVVGDSPGGAMARRLLPGMIITFLVLGWLRLQGERLGLYGAGTGVALYTLTNISVFAVLIWWNARWLHDADAERTLLAQQQRDSESRVRLLLDSTAEAIYGIDVDGRCTFINQSCLRLLGYTDSSQLLGQDMHALIHHARPDGTAYAQADCPIYSALRTDAPAHVDDEVFWRADGSAMAVEYWSYPMHRDGVLIGAVVTFLDISERKQAQERLHQSEERVRTIIATASDAFVAIESSGIVIDWNARAETAFGWSREEIIGRQLSDTIIPHRYRQAHEHGLSQYLVTGAGRIFNTPVELTALDRDGREFPVELTIWPVQSMGVQTFNAFIRDITQRKQIEEVQAKFAAIVESSDDAIISKTLSGIITTWNPGAERIFGYSAAEAIGRPMAILIPPQRLGEEQQVLAQLARGERVHLETVRVRKDGTPIDVAATVSPLIDAAGHVTGASTVVRDITARKRAEDNILALNAELSANASQLQQTNRELEAFSYTISHDLRAPLRHIDGYARMLQEDAVDQLDAGMRRYLNAISTAAQQMGALIDDLLAFSRLGRKPMDHRAVDMRKLVEQSLGDIGADAARVSVAPLPAVQGDPTLLRQVWVNLLSNAIKYTAPRGAAARIEVTGEQVDGMARYRIRDNGVGFDMRYADKLFGVFQRLHSQDEFEGTGVGLAIVQRIVVRHGGSIVADAEPGVGATFTFALPMVETTAIESQPVEERA